MSHCKEKPSYLNKTYFY